MQSNALTTATFHPASLSTFICFIQVLHVPAPPPSICEAVLAHHSFLSSCEVNDYSCDCGNYHSKSPCHFSHCQHCLQPSFDDVFTSRPLSHRSLSRCFTIVVICPRANKYLDKNVCASFSFSFFDFLHLSCLVMGQQLNSSIIKVLLLSCCNRHIQAYKTKLYIFILLVPSFTPAD